MKPADILAAWERAASEQRDDRRREALAEWALRHGRELAALAVAHDRWHMATRPRDALLLEPSMADARAALLTATCAACGAHNVTRPDGARICSAGCAENEGSPT